MWQVCSPALASDVYVYGLFVNFMLICENQRAVADVAHCLESRALSQGHSCEGSLTECGHQVLSRERLSATIHTNTCLEGL